MSEDFELVLYDRLNIIRDTISKYGEDNFYVSFSGGKDSTVLHYLIDMAIPNNKIPRVFINTGIEYNDIVSFVNELSKEDDRFITIRPNKPIKQMLEENGYPFKSKEHSMRVEQFNRGVNGNFIKKYTRQTDYNGSFICPKKLMYQFEERGKYNYSNKCCNELKKKPIRQWEKENNKKVSITGMRREEGGNRRRLTCAIFKNNKLIHFHPLIPVSEEFLDWFIDKYNIKLCKLYYPPFNFVRTGCKGCPFSLKLRKQLEIMEEYLPAERKQCEIIWKPVYDEYRRIKYRLKTKKDT